MTRQQGLNSSTIITVVGCIAAMLFWVQSVSGDRLLLSSSAAKLERFESHHLSGGLRLKMGGQVKSRTFQNIELPTAPLLGLVEEDGDLVFLAGVSWNKTDVIGKGEPFSIETADGQGPTNWYFTVEMLFIPRQSWRIRTILAFDSADIHDGLVVVPSQEFDPLHVGVAISFDYGVQSPLVLGLEYGRLLLEGRDPNIPSGSDKPDRKLSAELLSETWVVSACLNIQF